MLGPVLLHQHCERRLHPLRPVLVVQPLQHSPVGVLAVRLARLHQQLPQSAHLHHLQHRVPQGVQETVAEAVPTLIMIRRLHPQARSQTSQRGRFGQFMGLGDGSSPGQNPVNGFWGPA